MKQILIIISILAIILSCQSKTDKNTENSNETSESLITTNENTKQYESQARNENKLSQHQIDILTKEMDRLFEQKLLTKYFYPNMSGCGGGLYGYYKDSTLLIIDATNRAELGFSSRKVYWHDGNIIKIDYREHFAEWGKYKENYPSDKFEWDPGKMTYTDTIYQITLGDKYQMQKITGSELISEKQDYLLIKILVDCGFEMKKELEIEKIIDKQKSR